MNKGIRFALITVFISGVSVFVNGLFVSGTNPVAFAFIRNCVVAGVLSMVVSTRLKGIERSGWIKLLLIGLIGGGLPFGLFFTGLAMTGPVTANIINKSLFLWVALFAVPVLKEKLSWVSLLGYGLIFYALFWGEKVTLSSGNLYVLSATVLWAVEHMIAKKTLPTVKPEIIAWARMLFGLPVLGVFAFATHATINVSISLLSSVIVSSMFLTAYMFFWYRALKYAPASLVSSVLVLAPVITIALKNYSAIDMWQSVLLFAGVACVAYFSHRTSYGV